MASNSTEGAPESAWSAGSLTPLAVVTPPIFGAMIASAAPSSSTAFLSETEHAFADRHGLDLGQLETERRHDVALLRLGHRAEEHARLAVMVGEAFRTDAQLVALLVGRVLRREGREAVIRAFARAGGSRLFDS
jgi:hypothetical protein